MSRIVYNTTTGEIRPDPRRRGGPVQGLAPELRLLDLIEPPPPAYDRSTHFLQQTRNFDLEAGTATYGWEVVSLPPRPPEPRWQEFRAALRGIPELQTLLQGILSVDAMAFLGVGVGLGQAAQGDGRTFAGVWSELLAAGAVPPPLAAAVQALAAAHDLPPEFVAGLALPEG
ncbi:MAG: hypothetical protein AAFX65_10620 [Cyanobacteria bacterium J06638_7]